MRNTKRPDFSAVLAGIVLIVSMTACTTTKIEYVREIPAITFPVFPPPDCAEYDEETDTVSMPLWYWQKIAEYKIDVDAARDYLTLLRGQVDVEGMRILSETGKKKTGARWRRRSDTEGMEALARKTREKTDKK